MSVGKRFLKGSSAALLVSSAGGNFIPSNVYADGSSFTLDKKKFLEKKSNKEDNSSSSNGYLVAFKSTVACWWLKFCESSVFKYFFGKSSESKKVEEKVPETVVLSEEKVKEIDELASKLKEKFGNKIKLEPYKDGKIQVTTVIGGHRCSCSVYADEDLLSVRIYYSKRNFRRFVINDDIENDVKEIVHWHDVVNRTLEKIDKLVLTGLFSRTVVEENGILLLEPTASCRKLLFKNRDNKYLHAILFDPYAMLSCFCFSKKYLEYVPEANALEDCCNKMKKDRFVENYDENSFKTFDNVVSEILEKASKNSSSDSQEFLLSSSL